MTLRGCLAKLTIQANRAEELDDSHSEMDSLVEWRREKVWEYRAMGCSIDEIVDILKKKPDVKISHGTVWRDLKAKQKEVEKGFKDYIEKDLPMQHNLAIAGLDKILKEAWRIYLKSGEDKTSLQALTVIQSAIMSKQSVLADPTQIEKAIKLVTKVRAQLSKSNQETEKDAESSSSLQSSQVSP